jgi:putative hydrolase of the HAD superfamily
MIRGVLLDFGATLVERISDRDLPLTQLRPVLFSETDAVLGDLKRAGYLLAVVSNTEQTDDEGMDRVLTSIGIRRHLDVVLTSISVGSRKPAGAIFLRALERLGCSAAEAVVVGDDAAVDIAGGVALGMLTVLVLRDGSEPPDSNADFVLPSLRDLTSLLDRLQPDAAAHDVTGSRSPMSRRVTSE